MLYNVLLVVIAVLLFGFIIFIHELGHFVTAKLSGIRVHEFAIGMGPTLFHFGKGETKYALRLLPIGGFCAMEGEDEESDDSHAFCNKPVWKRILVVVMGAVMNVLLGIVLMMVLLGQKSDFTSTTIAKFYPNSATESAGLKVNDQFYSINGYRTYTDKDISFALATADPNSMSFQVVRDGKTISFNHVKLNSTVNNGKKIVTLDFMVLPIK
jgi:regulator of sigma E protease